MFWDIADEGAQVDGAPLYLAEALNGILAVRPTSAVRGGASRALGNLGVGANSSPAALQPADDSWRS